MGENSVVVSGGFDQLQSPEVRFLDEAAQLGSVHVALWSDAVLAKHEGRKPKFPEGERRYFLESLRYVDRVIRCRDWADSDALPLFDDFRPAVWVVREADDSAKKRAFCAEHGLRLHVVRLGEMQGFPEHPAEQLIASNSKRVLVTGCYDWFHTGHIRFFEEVSELGDLYVVVGHDANIRLLKGEGHPLFNENERRYMVQSIRHVKQALLSTGTGWLDAEPEIRKINPHIYAVNEDGDRPEKKEYCQSHGIEYRVLKRIPKEGMPRRQSTVLRGF